MNYLTSSIRQELLSRIRDNDDSGQNTLVIDFEADQKFIDQLPYKQVQFVSLLQPRQRVVCGALPTLQVNDRFDSVIILCQLAWFDFRQVIVKMMQLLRPNGKFYFATLGPDTLIELSNLFNKIDDFAHVYRFIDMHHLGDQLLQVGFVQPILDVERLKVIYPDITSLFFDLKEKKIVGHYPNQRKTLLGKQRYRALLTLAEQQKECQMTFEVIYGYARKPDRDNSSVKVMPPIVH